MLLLLHWGYLLVEWDQCATQKFVNQRIRWNLLRWFIPSSLNLHIYWKTKVCVWVLWQIPFWIQSLVVAYHGELKSRHHDVHFSDSEQNANTLFGISSPPTLSRPVLTPRDQSCSMDSLLWKLYDTFDDKATLKKNKDLFAILRRSPTVLPISSNSGAGRPRGVSFPSVRSKPHMIATRRH